MRAQPLNRAGSEHGPGDGPASAEGPRATLTRLQEDQRPAGWHEPDRTEPRVSCSPGTQGRDGQLRTGRSHRAGLSVPRGPHLRPGPVPTGTHRAVVHHHLRTGFG